MLCSSELVSAECGGRFLPGSHSAAAGSVLRPAGGDATATPPGSDSHPIPVAELGARHSARQDILCCHPHRTRLVAEECDGTSGQQRLGQSGRRIPSETNRDACGGRTPRPSKCSLLHSVCCGAPGAEMVVIGCSAAESDLQTLLPLPPASVFSGPLLSLAAESDEKSVYANKGREIPDRTETAESGET